MDLGLNNKVIIVTGGAKGFREGIVRILSGEGAIVVLVGRNETDNRKLQKEIETAGGKTFLVEAELGDPADCEKAVQAIIQKYGRIEGLVNNAGVHDGAGSGKVNSERFLESLQENLVYYYLMTHFALPYLKISKGAIVNISTKAAETDPRNTTAYAAANGGVNALTREWAVELLKYGIRVNAGIVAEKALEIGNTVAFLLSEKSSHTTGQLIQVDGE